MFEHYEPEDRYDRDDDGLVINGENTYQEVANKLWENRVHFVPWTDEAGGRYDLWLSFGGEQAAARSEHEGRHRGIERMIERQQYGHLRPACPRRFIRLGRDRRDAQESGHESCDESCEHGPKAAKRDRLRTTHRFTPDWCGQTKLPHP